jgi:cytoplasmic iron level regulating protein YaaA (DUF328/UPF0246 family)
MLIILSPAKTLDETPLIPKGVTPTVPHFSRDAAALAKQLARLSEKQIGELMHISPKLAALNAGRFKGFAKHDAYPCAWMFRGDVYDGFDIDTLPVKAMPHMQKRLRILSGLYGVLMPFDAMRPYRLEMGTKLKTAKGKDLYAYWGTRVAKQLNESGEGYVLNLASVEYASVIDWDACKLKPITAHFKERKGNQVKVVSLFAKRARGVMARWVIEQQAGPTDLPQFAQDGYRYAPDLSTPSDLVFVR